MPSVNLRTAERSDLETIVDLFARSRAAALPFLPILHSREEDAVFLGNYIALGQMMLAQIDGAVAGFMALTPGWIEQLYLDPGQRRQGIGRVFVDYAKERQPEIRLWCFADNGPGCAFYRAQGFAEERRTAGDNEAGLPDILFRWRRSP